MVTRADTREASGVTQRRARPGTLRLVRAASEVLKYGVLLLFSGFFIIPWVWMISTSLKSAQELSAWPIVWIPEPPRFDNYLAAFGEAMFGTFVINTLVVALASVAGAVISNSLIAYGFSRIRWPGRDLVFGIVLATMILPGFVTFIPLYIVFRRLEWLNTYRPLIIPVWLGSPFFIFLLRQFFLTISPELSDAARIDGCGYFGIFARIFLPLSKPAVATMAIFTFMWNWNSFMGPLIYLSSSDKWTLTLGLHRFRGMYGMTAWNLLMAASLVTVLPCITLFFFAQRYFIQGIVITGVKG